MRRAWIVSVLSLLVPVLLSGQAMKPSAGEGNMDEQLLVLLELEWGRALRDGDVAAVDRILASEYVAIQATGGTQTKAEALEALRTGAYDATEFIVGDDLKVRLFGDVAIVTGSDTEKSQYGGKDTSGWYHWTDVFVKCAGHWQAVATHSSKVPEPEQANYKLQQGN